MQTRRTLLATGALGLAALAGCTAIADDPTPSDDGNDPGSSGPADDDTEPSELDVPRDATHRAEIVRSDDAPDLPVEPHVSLADPFATSGSPPVLRVDVANPTDEPVTIGEYRDVVFQYVGSADGALLLLPHSERSTEGEPDRATPDYETDGEDCWRLAEPMAITMEYGTVEIPAGGTLTAFVGCYGDPDADDCLPTGEHRFETTYAVSPLGDMTDGETPADEPPQAQWGFSLSVEEL